MLYIFLLHSHTFASFHGGSNVVIDAINLQNIVQEPTREIPLSSSLNYLIITTRRDLVSLVGTYPLGISDHNIIYSTIILKNKKTTSEENLYKAV